MTSMSSAIIVLVCLALPVAFTYRTRITLAGGSSGGFSPPVRTAQSTHWRRRLQHATCGLAIFWGYLRVITDVWTGERGRWSRCKLAPCENDTSSGRS